MSWNRGGDFYQFIKQYAIDSFVTTIVGNNNDEIFNSIIDGYTIKDIKTEKELYDHIYELGLTKKVNFYNKEPLKYDGIECKKIEKIDKCNLLVIDDNNVNTTNVNDIVNENLNNVDYAIIVKKPNNLKINNNEWVVMEKNNATVLEKKHKYDNFSIYQFIYFYEIMYYLNKIFEKNNIQYFLIRESCLGLIRNRSHILDNGAMDICIYNDSLTSELEKDLKSVNILFGKGPDGGDRFYFDKKQSVVRVSYYNDIKDEFKEGEIGNLKYYNFGMIRVKSLEFPIEYLKRNYPNNFTYDLPKLNYDCYCNIWSSYTSNYWKKAQIEHLNKVYKCLVKNNVKCWIDCGTLLGAARNEFICLFDDDCDIGIFYEDEKKVYSILKKNKLKRIMKIVFVNKISFDEFYDATKTYNGKENINYNFVCKNFTTIEFRQYIKKNNLYISEKDTLVSEFHKIPGLLMKRATKNIYFDELDKIKLGKYVFDCPSNYKEYLECDARYGKGSIMGNPIRDCKPGVVVLYDS